MNNPKTYTINSVNDFLSIPPNRLRACLREFRTSLELAHGLSGMAGIDGDKVKVDVSMPAWIWIDDRKRNQDVQFCDMTVKVASDEPNHTGRFRLALVMANGYGLDVSWEDRRGLEDALRLVVAAMDDEGGIDLAIKVVVDTLAKIKAAAATSESDEGKANERK